MLITHDRNLIREVATRIVEVVDGKVSVIDGDYEYYLQQREDAPSTTATSKVDAPSAVRRERPSRDRSGRSDARKLKARLSQVEREMEEASSQAAVAAKMLADPTTYSQWDKDQVADVVEGYERSAKRLKDLESAWEELAERLEAAEPS